MEVKWAIATAKVGSRGGRLWYLGALCERCPHHGPGRSARRPGCERSGASCASEDSGGAKSACSANIWYHACRWTENEKRHWPLCWNRTQARSWSTWNGYVSVSNISSYIHWFLWIQKKTPAHQPQRVAAMVSIWASQRTLDLLLRGRPRFRKQEDIHSNCRKLLCNVLLQLLGIS